jgi:hypothetical protein
MSTLAPSQPALFNQNEMREIANPDAKSVLQALADEKWDFRTIDGLVKETDLPADRIRRILDSYPELVRRSPVRDRLGRSLYTLKSRAMKIPEKAAFARLLLSKTP